MRGRNGNAAEGERSRYRVAVSRERIRRSRRVRRCGTRARRLAWMERARSIRCGDSAKVAPRVVEGWGEDRQTCHASAGYRVSTAKCKGSYIIDLSLIL